MTKLNHLEVILLCPTGKDAQLIQMALRKESIDSVISFSLEDLFEKSEEAGVLLIADEALNPQGIDYLNQQLVHQETWSDIPIILLISSNKNKVKLSHRLESFIASGNVTLLERPLQPLSLVSATQVALRSRRRQYQVRDLLASQAEATKLRDEFISIASHELKTPLTSLRLQTQMGKRAASKDEPLDQSKVVKQMDSTINQIDRLTKLVDDMLDISRINAGKLNIHRSPFNLSLLIHELIDRFSSQFEAVNITLNTQIEELVIGNWDSYKLEQVINNLFSNVIRYSPNKKVTVGLKRNDKFAILNVQDEGPGIDLENQKRIFERFERASSRASGLGLGLYITKQIVDLHEGQIEVESVIGKGSNFIIKLPF